MKLSDGFWLNKPGYNVNFATEAFEITADERSIHVFCTTGWIANRGQMLGGPALEVTFTSTLENSIKVTVDHFRGQLRKGPAFVLNEDSSFKPVINKLVSGGYELISGNTKVVIGAEKGAWDALPLSILKWAYTGSRTVDWKAPVSGFRLSGSLWS